MSWFAEDIKLQCRVTIGGGACPPSPPSFKSHGICCGISVQYPETLTLTGSAIRPGLLPWVCLQQLAAVTVAGPTGAVQLTATRPAPPSQSRQDSVSHCRLRPGWGDIRPFLQCGNTQVHSPLLQVSLSFLTRLQWTGTCCYRTEILTRQTDVGGGDSFTPFATPLAIPFCYRVPGPQYKQPVKPGLRWSDSNRKRTILVIKKRSEMP